MPSLMSLFAAFWGVEGHQRVSDSLVSCTSAWVFDPFHLSDGIAWDFIALFYAAPGGLVVDSCRDWDKGNQEVVCSVFHADVAAEALYKYQFSSGVSYPCCCFRCR